MRPVNPFDSLEADVRRQIVTSTGTVGLVVEGVRFKCNQHRADPAAMVIGCHCGSWPNTPPPEWSALAAAKCGRCLPDAPGYELSGGNEKKLPDGRWVRSCDGCSVEGQIATPGTGRARHTLTVDCDNDCVRFGGKVPGHVYGSNWDLVPCRTCMGAMKMSVAVEVMEVLPVDRGHSMPGRVVYVGFDPSGAGAIIDHSKDGAEVVALIGLSPEPGRFVVVMKVAR